MKRLYPLLLVIFLFLAQKPAFCANYEIKKVTDDVYAAIALPGGKTNSNAMFIVTESGVILAGAHFVSEGMAELTAQIAQITSTPIRYVVLTHHHRGYNYMDFDFPPGADVITSWQTWQALKSETRPFKNPALVFDTSMTFQRGKARIILNNTERGQADGDVILYMPDTGVLFTSDLVYNDAVGYMGDGYMRDWVMNLDMLLELNPKTVIPGVGKVTDSNGVNRFRLFMKDFLSEILSHIEKGESLSQTKKGFRLPKYENVPGYRTFLGLNLERAYSQLKEK